MQSHKHLSTCYDSKNVFIDLTLMQGEMKLWISLPIAASLDMKAIFYILFGGELLFHIFHPNGNIIF